MIPKESMRKMAFPIKCFASSGFFRPMERLKLAAPPMPKSRETAVQVMVRGKSDVGGSVSLHTDAVADEELVYHIVEGAHEHGDDTGNGEAGHQMVDRFHAQGIFMLFVQRITSFSSVERKNKKK